MAFYIGGPVQRPGTKLPKWIYECYTIISKTTNAMPPSVERQLETLEPSLFNREIHRRIYESEGVVAVFLPGDESTPVECAIAAMLGKRVLLIAAESESVPRVLSGMKGVRLARFGPNIENEIRLFRLRSDL